VTRQEKRTIVHLLYYSAERRTPKLDLVEDIVPLFDVPLSLKAAAAPNHVYLTPTGKALAFHFDGAYVRLKVPVVRGHAMVVVE
jgi:hypothetical protein